MNAIKTGLSLLMLAGLTIVASQSAFADKKMAAPAMMKFEISDGPAIKSIKKSLTGKAGDLAKGEDMMANRKKGNCFACHVISSLAKKAAKNPKKYSDMGNIGPSLDGVAGRYTEGELRALLVDAKLAFPDTIMPGFYRTTNFTRVRGKFKGKTVLKAQEVEDILALLVTFK